MGRASMGASVAAAAGGVSTHGIRPLRGPIDRPCARRLPGAGLLMRCRGHPFSTRVGSAHRSPSSLEVRADMLAVLRAPALRQPATLQGAYAAVVSGQVRIIAALNAQIAGLHEVMAEHFGRHPDADIYLSQPGFAVVFARRLGQAVVAAVVAGDERQLRQRVGQLAQQDGAARRLASSSSFTPRMSLSRRWRRFSSSDSSGYTEPQGDEAVATHGSDELVRTSHGRSLQRDAERQRHVDARLAHRAQQARHLAVVPELHPRGGLLLHGGGDVVGPDVRMRSMITGCSRPPGPGRASWRASRG